MRLLIITQVVDKNHPILGFFHRWLEEFSKHCERVHVIALQEGEHSLPPNVFVHSLGKESGKGRLTFLLRFYKYLWQYRNDYDSVFVHMNQEYVLLGAVFWKVIRKKFSLWRNHYAGNVITNLAVGLSSRVFYTSASSYTKRFSRAIQMPIGIDNSVFYPRSNSRKEHSLLYVGRISPSKKIEIILHALPEILKNIPDVTLTIVGPNEDKQYKNELVAIIEKDFLPVTFIEPIPWEQLPEVYGQHELCINMSPPGMFDKVIGEALLCGCDVVTTNKDLAGELGRRVIEANPQSLCHFVSNFDYSKDEVSRIVSQVIDKHSLSSLVKKVMSSI